MRTDGGATGRDGGPTLPPEVIIVEVDSFSPRRGPTGGGTEITITGRGFVPGTQVLFAGQPLLEQVIYSERTIVGKTPPSAAGVAPVLVENRAAEIEVPGGFTYDAPVRIDAISPAQGSTAGGTTLTITGSGFLPDSAIVVGVRPAFAVSVASATRITAVVPPGDAGPVPVTVANRSGTDTREGGFTYLADVGISSLEPPAGPVGGGNTVTLRGRGFDATAQVTFGSVPAPVVTLVSATELAVRVPGASGPGVVDVAVRTAAGAAVATRAYGYHGGTGALALVGVVPGNGSASGGTEAWLVGSGFDAGISEVRFGGALATDLTVLDPGLLRVRTPPGTPGPVDVDVSGAAGNASLVAGYRYEAPLTIAGVRPASGPVEGGTPVTLEGEGFAPGAEVFFGPLAARSVQVVDANHLVAVTGPGAAGAVDVMVRQGTRRATIPGAFVYLQEPRLFRVSPDRGAIAGGTLVTLNGIGLIAGSQPYFNGAPAVEVRLVNASTLVARAPPGVEGPADVSLVSQGGATVLPGAYRYFDPAWVYGGTSGPPIAGALNVTVLDSWRRARLAGAFVTLATRGTTAYQGVTNADGQIVFSGPDLAGRQTITAAKDDYTASSFVGFDAENVTLLLSPLTVTVGPGQPGPPVPVIRGTIKDAFKPIPPAPPGWRRAVVVLPTAPSTSQARWYTLSYGQIIEDDGRDDHPYEISARYGDLAVYALGGHISADGQRIIPYVMGIRRFVQVLLETPVVEGIDFSIDAALNSTLDVRLLGAPPLRPEGPTIYRMRAFLDLGIDGVVTFFQNPESTGEPRVVQEHLARITGIISGSSYAVTAGAYTLSSGYETSPLSEVARNGVTDLTAPLELGPFMDIARAARPRSAGVLEDFRFAWGLNVPPEPTYFIIYLPQQLDQWAAAIWEVIVPGNLRELVVPDLASLAGFRPLDPAGAFDWWVIAGEAPGFDIDGFDYRDFYPRRSYSMTHHGFVTE